MTKKTEWIVASVLLGAAAITAGVTAVRYFTHTHAAPDAAAAGAEAASAAGESDAPPAWCAEHDVPEAECTTCDPSLIPEFEAANDWCQGHGLPESHCERCNPGVLSERRAAALAASAGGGEAWCREHDVPEAECTTCDPSLIPEFEAANDWCRGHDLPESHCERCNPGVLGERRAAALAGASRGARPAGPAEDYAHLPRYERPPAPGCDSHLQRVRLASAEVARRAGVEVAPVVRRTLELGVDAPAELSYDRNRLAHLAPRTRGVVKAVHHDLGDRVGAGDLLVEVDATALGAAKAALHQAKALVSLWERNAAREGRLLEQGVGTARDVLEAETGLAEGRIALASARQELRTLGLDADEVDAVAASGDASSLLAVRAPFAGVVVERSAAPGEVVDPERPLFAVADVSRMWALVAVDEAEADRLAVGQAVRFRPDAGGGETFAGELTWVSSQVDPRTRTVAARAVLPNPNGRLRAHAFGEARVVTEPARPRLLVPKAAVQWDGCCNVVFVRKSDVLYEPRKVRLGAPVGASFCVREGLAAGEEVATTASFLLKTEIMRDAIGAGCCEPAGE